MGQPLKQPDEHLWTTWHRDRGLCTWGEVGTAMPPPTPPPENVVNLEEARRAKSTTATVLSDTDATFTRLGRVKYLTDKKNRRFFQRCLEQTLVETPPPQLVQILLSRAQS